MDTNKKLLNHIVVGFFSLVLFFLFYNLTDNIWKSFARVSYILLFIILSIGPLIRIWKPMSKILSWRGEFGIWFAIISLAHVSFIYFRNLSFFQVLGINQVDDNYIFTNPGRTLTMLLGIVSFFWTFILAITSSKKAINFLGPVSWKWIHNFAYVIFYLVTFHALYFHFMRNFQDKFGYLIIILALIIIILQLIAFIKTVKNYKKGQKIIN